MLPNKGLPVCEPKGFGLPKGFGVKGLLLGLFICPKTDWDPKGLPEDCPNALLEPNIFSNGNPNQI